MAGKANASERRSSPRIEKHERAEVWIEHPAPVGFPIQVMNISEGGVRFIASERLWPGEEGIFVHSRGEHRIRILDSKPLFDGYATRAKFIDS